MADRGTESQNVSLLSIKDIAEWQLPEPDDTEKKEIIAALPALQRSAVWKARQIEALWDSIMRGFPIGSFLVTPFVEGSNMGKKETPYGNNPNANHYLLDGQQRANAIALGYFDPWSNSKSAPAVLWVDLEETGPNDDREYCFRVLTRSHPWGYSRNSDCKSLAVGQRRDAFEAYIKGGSDLGYKKVYEIPLTDVWPWEAVAPIPVPFLLKAIDECRADADAVRKCLLNRLSKLPFWSRAVTHRGELHAAVKTRLGATMAGGRFSTLVKCMADAVYTKQKPFAVVPVQVLPPKLVQGAKESREKDATPPSAVETMFIRVNAGGTKLEGEELIYSILKSISPKAYDAVEKIDCNLVSPARLVMIVSRLILAQDEEATPKRSEPPPPMPNVARFRRLMRPSVGSAALNFEAKLEKYIGYKVHTDVESQAKRVFSIAHELLTVGDFALPSILASDLAQRSQDVFFLFLFWIDRMLERGCNPVEILDEDMRRQMLGTLTAISWFAMDQGECVSILWPELMCCDKEELPGFFSSQHFRQLLELGDDSELRLLPIFSPETVELAIMERIIKYNMEDGSKHFDNPQSPFWLDWRWYEDFVGKQPPPTIIGDKNVEVLVRMWSPGRGTEAGEQDRKKAADSWTHFIERLRRNTRVLLYAQRKWIKTWWESRPEDLDELERPWDFDHIHPASYVYYKQNIPQIIRDWHETIGNLRAWPFEANRSDGNVPPCKKFVDSSGADEFHRYENQYGIESLAKKLEASVIDNMCLQHWQQSTPEENFEMNYLADPANIKCRKQLILAITTRFVEIYRSWYNELRLYSLMPPCE